jgi:hypothetical protein
LEWTPTTEGEHLLTAVAVDNRGGETISDVVTVTVTEAPKEPALTLLSSATVNGEYTAKPEAALDEGNKVFTVKTSGGMRFYRLRSTDEVKLKMTTIRVQDGSAVIAYEIVEE